MKWRFLKTLAAVSAPLATCAIAAEPQHHPAKEDTYTITSVMEIVQPVDPAAMSDDFQDARMIYQDTKSCLVEITYYPLYRPTVGENPNWRVDDANMKDYLKPTPTENWDEGMHRDLVAQLKRDGIDPDRLTDKELVTKVSSWAIKRSHTTDAFGIWAVYFPQGKATVFPPLRSAFDDQRPDKTWTDQQDFDQELFGKSMFYNGVRGSCTSSSIYIATIFRALGIPARIIFCIPPFDPNDKSQAQMFYNEVHHNGVRQTVKSALDNVGGFDNHLFNEVYIAGRWMRLNYSTLGQPVLDSNYFGLLTHIYTSADISQVPLAQTWGERYFNYPGDQPPLSSKNPYRLLKINDHFGSNAKVDNPPVEVAEYKTVTITALYAPNSTDLPGFIRDAAAPLSYDLLAAFKERVKAPYPMRSFYKHAGHKFLLSAQGKPSINVIWDGRSISADDVETIGLKIDTNDKAKMSRGIAYSLSAENVSDTYKWTILPNVTFMLPPS